MHPLHVADVITSSDGTRMLSRPAGVFVGNVRISVAVMLALFTYEDG